MFCDKCQEIVNLDVLLTTIVVIRPAGRNPGASEKARPHHKDFAALVASAEEGCVICSLVRANSWRNPRFASHLTPESKELITFRFDHRRDVVVFDTDPQSEYAQSWSMGFCGIKLSAIEGDPVTSLMPGVFTSRPVADDSGSEGCFKIAQYWFKTCLETHDSRCQVKENVPLPTRVVDVGHLESPFIKLYISNGEHGQWLTLSHCWGKSHPATTTKSNLNSYCNGIVLSTLPKTFQDAIFITRRLGYKYLWIDSLCIVQDSMLDWQLESVKMNTIYANSVLNLSADAAIDSFEGRTIPGFRYIASKLVSKLPYTQAYGTMMDLQMTTIFNKEAGSWQKQSSHIADYGILPADSPGVAARVPSYCEETRPHKIHDQEEQDSYITSLYQIPYQSLPSRYVYEMGNDARRSQIVEWWYRQINDYIDRQLTFPHDKFPAFSGIAKTYSDRTQYRYKAGLMVEDFRKGLLWQTCGRPVDMGVAPSWSWAVVGYTEEAYGHVYELNYAHQTYVNDANEVELVDISVKNLGDNQFGQVVSGSLTLRGLCHRLKELLKTTANTDFYFLYGWHDYGYSRDRDYQPFGRDISPSREAMRLHLDVKDESNSTFSQREDVHILRIGMFSSMANLGMEEDPFVEATSYLILQELPGLEASYRRIGIARILGSGIKSPDWKMKTVTIL
ncbi:HET-domain-containing protein [Stipitochalara longipes BDJ]|nr:HET-domain-containing protein [Stipitochalara longipes BDJ]